MFIDFFLRIILVLCVFPAFLDICFNSEHSVVFWLKQLNDVTVSRIDLLLICVHKTETIFGIYLFYLLFPSFVVQAMAGESISSVLFV